MKRIKSFWLKYWRGILGVIFTLASSTLGFAGAGVMLVAPYQTMWTFVQGGVMIGASFISAYIVARTLKD